MLSGLRYICPMGFRGKRRQKLVTGAFSLLLTAAASLVLQAQTLTVQVRNANGFAVPFANLSTSPAEPETLTNFDGYAQLPAGTASLLVQHPEYQPTILHLEPVSDTLRLVLETARPLRFPETPDLQAEFLIRRLLANKPLLDPAAHAYKFQAYHKLTVSANDRPESKLINRLLETFLNRLLRQPPAQPVQPTHLFMMEAATERTFVPGKADHERIQASKATGIRQSSLLTPSTQLAAFQPV